MEEVPAQPSPVQNETASQPPTDVLPPEKPSRFTKKVKIIIAIASVIIIFLIAGIAGAYRYSNNNQTPTEEKETLQTPTPTPNPTAGWETYEGDGFSFKYPKDWTLTTTKSGAVLHPPGINVEELIGSTTKTLFIESYMSEFNPEDCKGPCPVNEKTSTEIINGLEAKKLEGHVPGTIGGNTPHRFIKYVYYKDGFYYVLNLSGADLNKFPQENKDVFDQILSTLTFTDQDSAVDTSEWKTYTNNDFGFSVQFPSSLNSREWGFEEIISENIVGFGPDVKQYKAYTWTINKYPNQSEEKINLLKEIQTMQNNDKNVREEINVNGNKASIITSTSKDLSEWISKTIIIKKGNDTYIIWNGGNNSKEFDIFYDSFQFTQ